MNRLPRPIEWLTDNGSCYTAREMRRFARDIGLEPQTTPIESPQSNGMAEAFARTLKRHYVRVSPKPDARSVLEQLPAWITHYNHVHPHRALGYRSPREYITRSTRRPNQVFRGQQQSGVGIGTCTSCWSLDKCWLARAGRGGDQRL